MFINAAALDGLYLSYSAAFEMGFSQVSPEWAQIATRVPSTTKRNEYGWLGQFPRLREWVGDRVVESMALHAYTIANRRFESTISVPRDDIEDDNYGVYTPLFQEMGYAAAIHPDELVFELVQNGFTELCYDGQPFFDTDHHVLDETNTPQPVSNMVAGANPPWFLLDTRRALKPFLWQERTVAELQTMNDMTDESVFMRGEYRYGIRQRGNAGFGFWQQAFASQAVLNDPNFDAAYASMMSVKSDHGRPLGVKPNLLLCGPSNRASALATVKSEARVLGATNTNFNAVDVLVVPWLD